MSEKLKYNFLFYVHSLNYKLINNNISIDTNMLITILNDIMFLLLINIKDVLLKYSLILRLVHSYPIV